MFPDFLYKIDVYRDLKLDVWNALHELWVSLMGSLVIATVLNVLVGRTGILQPVYCLNNPIKDAHREPL